MNALGAAWLMFDALGLIAAVIFPPFRRKLIEFVLHARRIYVEQPLRLLTGRRRPDYRRIRELERELGGPRSVEAPQPVWGSGRVMSSAEALAAAARMGATLKGTGFSAGH